MNKNIRTGCAYETTQTVEKPGLSPKKYAKGWWSPRMKLIDGGSVTRERSSTMSSSSSDIVDNKSSFYGPPDLQPGS